MSQLKDYKLEITKTEDKVYDFKMQCPHCELTYAQDRFRGDQLTRETIDHAYIRYGSPVRRCNGCGEMFIDRSMREMALSAVPVTSVLSKYRRRGVIDIVAGSIIATVCLFVSFEIDGLLGIVGLGMIVLGIIRLLAKPQNLKTDKELKEEMEASKQRIADAGYMECLKENGIVE